MAGYSNVNFDLWLLLHKGYFGKTITNNDGYIKDVRKVYRLKETNIKEEKAIQNILSQITLEDVKRAIENGKRLEREKRKSGETILLNHYTQPFIQIHHFVEHYKKTYIFSLQYVTYMIHYW